MCYAFDMENLPIDSDKYLEKIKKTNFDIPEQEIEASLLRLSKPFDSITATINGIEIDYENIKIDIEYKPHTYLRDGETYISSEMKVVDTFMIKTEDKEFNLLSILPSGIRIIVQSSEKETGAILNVDGISEISIAGEIDSPKMIAVLLHEIGHIFDEEKLGELGIKGYDAQFKGLMDDKENADIAEEIRKERIANAFALKVLRPFMKNPIVKMDMLNLLKYDALASYYYSAKEEIKKRSQRSSHSHYSFMDVENFSGDEW
jgi:hypothetical protein